MSVYLSQCRSGCWRAEAASGCIISHPRSSKTLQPCSSNTCVMMPIDLRAISKGLGLQLIVTCQTIVRKLNSWRFPFPRDVSNNSWWVWMHHYLWFMYICNIASYICTLWSYQCWNSCHTQFDLGHGSVPVLVSLWINIIEQDNITMLYNIYKIR